MIDENNTLFFFFWNVESNKCMELFDSQIFGRVRGRLKFPGDEEISGEHAKIVCRNKEWFLTDLNSSNGTFINDKRMTPDTEYKLSLYDLVQIGMQKLIFMNDDIVNITNRDLLLTKLSGEIERTNLDEIFARAIIFYKMEYSKLVTIVELKHIRYVIKEKTSLKDEMLNNVEKKRDDEWNDLQKHRDELEKIKNEIKVKEAAIKNSLDTAKEQILLQFESEMKELKQKEEELLTK